MNNTVGKLKKLQQLFTKQQTNQLGRWGNGSPETKLYHANIDNCGDVICGNAQFSKYKQLSVGLQKQSTNQSDTFDIHSDDNYIRYFFY